VYLIGKYVRYNLLVHPKEEHSVVHTGEFVYKIPCHNCSSTYIGETGRSYGERQEEHSKEVESVSNRTLTRAERKELNRNQQVNHNRSCG